MRELVDFFLAILLLFSFATSIVGLVREYRRDPAGHRATMPYFAGYIVHSMIAVGALIWWVDGPQSPHVAIGLTALILAWICYGGLWTARLISSKRLVADPVAPWVMRFPGFADAGIALLATLGLAMLLSGWPPGP